MAITHVFKGASDNCGTFAYIENGALVVGENASRGAEYLFRGSIREFGYSDVMLIVHNRNPELVTDIYEYHWRNTFNRAAHKQEVHMNRNKLCEIKVDRKDSLQELVYHLTANGYEVQTAVIWKEFPNTGIDYWQIAIFDKE